MKNPPLRLQINLYDSFGRQTSHERKIKADMNFINILSRFFNARGVTLLERMANDENPSLFRKRGKRASKIFRHSVFRSADQIKFLFLPRLRNQISKKLLPFSVRKISIQTKDRRKNEARGQENEKRTDNDQNLRADAKHGKQGNQKKPQFFCEFEFFHSKTGSIKQAEKTAAAKSCKQI